MADDPELERLRRLLTPAPEKKPSRLKKMLARLAGKNPKYGRQSKKKKKDDQAA
jgi:hypothetical protein